MARFIPTIKINLRGKEAQEFEHDTLVGRSVHDYELLFLAGGLALVAFGILFLNGINPLHASGNGWVPIAMGGLWSGSLIAKIGLRVLTRRLIPEDSLYHRLNVDYGALNRTMQEHDVQPRLIVNGKRYYARTDFGEISTLLRASSAPQTGAETLLRVPRDQSQPSAQNLLHPVNDTPHLQTPSANIPVVPDQPQNIQNRADKGQGSGGHPI